MFNLLHFNRNIRSIRRSRLIGQILIKYGFDQVLELMNLNHVVARGRRLLKRNEAIISQLSPAERLRLALEELGPTFVKLGQVLSTRADLIPQAYIRELAKLQDMAPSFPFAQITAQIEAELGQDVDNIFTELDPTPLAAASIAQVHTAVLPTGERVAIKVRRPGIVATVEADIDVMMGLAMLAERHIPGLNAYDPIGVVKEFARTIRREMDFTREGHTIEKFAANFSGSTELYFPKVYWDLSAKGVLTLEYIDGIKVSDLPALQQAGIDQRVIARNGAGAFLRMVLEHGFFHGDPHPGNVLILPGNVICLLDYGMVGRLDEKLRAYLADILMAIDKRDVDEIISILLYSGDISEALDARTLRRDISDFIDSYYELPLDEIEVGKLLMEFIELSSTYHIKLQPDLILLAKALVTVEGMGRVLDPHFDMMTILRPFMAKALKERLSPPRLAKDLTSIFMSYLNLTRTLPRDIKEIISRVNRNKFKIDLEHRGLDHFIKELDKSANRVSSSMIIAALIIGSSIVMQIDKGPKLLGFPIFAFLGYTIAAVIGFWWIIAIIRSGRL
jgi:ubiquinone biosynthesis protein